MFALLSVAALLLPAAISVHTELVAVPVTVPDRRARSLGFVAASRGDGPSFRAIDVTVTAEGRGRLRIRTRSGYVVEP